MRCATIEQARDGGCCVCPPDCDGVDADDRTRACPIECGYCMNGCPAPNSVPCECAADA